MGTCGFVDGGYVVFGGGGVGGGGGSGGYGVGGGLDGGGGGEVNGCGEGFVWSAIDGDNSGDRVEVVDIIRRN